MAKTKTLDQLRAEKEQAEAQLLQEMCIRDRNTSHPAKERSRTK